jgi:chorismate-pyruvate lyase
MTTASHIARQDRLTVLDIFPLEEDFRALEAVPSARIPPPYHGLLVHEHHMTVSMEAFHGEAVDVRIIDRCLEGDWYARKILLATRASRRIVLYGIVRIDFRLCPAGVREAIVAGDTPLGRVLIEHNVMRRIQPLAFLRVQPGPAALRWFGVSEPRTTYGRLAYLHCNEQPAIEVLEVVAP